MGTAVADFFMARTANNLNTLQDGDKIDGGAGVDTVYADFVPVTNGVAHTPNLINVETVVVRAQSASWDNGSANNIDWNLVQIDAQRSLAVNAADKVTADLGVTRWESSNSRADVVIEDVRIGNVQKTKDVTIAMVETDPGNVDFGVYFDQQSLRNAGTGQTSLTINIMDTGAAATAATAATPLLNNPYDLFKLGVNGVLSSLQLDKAAVAAADTYEALLAVFNKAIVGTGISASLTGTFTITDPLKGGTVTGKSLVLTAGPGVVISTPDGSGWFNTTGASVPANSNIYTTFNAGSTTTELVTSQIFLDDVGRGSTGGDLLVGGLSVGATSTSRGVERFEITVGDNSKLQTINGTNNALREVTIINGATSNSVASAYSTTVLDEGDLTVNGTNFVNPATRNALDTIVADNALPGANLTVNANGVNGNATAVTHSGAGAAGFTDVRLIDASAFKGKLAFTAAITSDVITKYVDRTDTAASPTADTTAANNVNFNKKGADFKYTGGIDNDTMIVTIDSNAAASRSSTVSGYADFTFAVNGGAGDDSITVAVQSTLQGNSQAWYNNQKLNGNVSVTAGDGNDTVRTPGAGDKLIDLGAGDDTAYTDNTGRLAYVLAGSEGGAAAAAYTAAAAAELALANAAAVTSNTTGFKMKAGTITGEAVSSAAAYQALVTLDAATPEVYVAASAPRYLAIQNAINDAVTNGGLTFEQAIALNTAYQSTTTASVLAAAPTTMVAPTLTVGATTRAAGDLVTAAHFAAGNALLSTYLAAAKTDAAKAVSADNNLVPAITPLLNQTQRDVVTATQAVNRAYDPVPSLLTFTSVVTTQGANATNTFTPVALAANETIIVNGTTYTGAGAGGATAAQVAAVMASGVASAQVTVSGTEAVTAWTKAAGTAANTVTYTSVAPGVAAALANTGVAIAVMAAPLEGAPVREVTTVTVAGTTSKDQTVTFDGVLNNFNAGQSATSVANQIGGVTYTKTITGAGVFTLAANTPGVLADITSASFVSAIPVIAAGTQTTVNNLAALKAALVVSATDANVVAALQAATNNGAITALQANQLAAQALATVAGGTMLQAEVDNTLAILTPLQTAATIANTAAQATLTTAIANDVAAVSAAADIAAKYPTAIPTNPVTTNIGGASTTSMVPVVATVANDSVGSAAATTAVTVAQTAVTTASTALTAANKVQADLAALKAAIVSGSTDLAVVTATAEAVGNNSITIAQRDLINGAATAVPGTVGTPVTDAQKLAVDAIINPLQATQALVVETATQRVTDMTTILDGTKVASEAAANAAANVGSSANLSTASGARAVFVFNTANQIGSYVLAQNDDRNLYDLKSDANTSNNFYNSTVKVSYKGIDVSVVVAGSGFKTTDLEINQAIKQAINADAVLSKLIAAADGPGNTLIVTSLTDGVQAATDLVVSVTLPAAVASTDVAGAAAAYSLATGSTAAQVQAAMTTAKAAFDTKGDYTTQLAESGASGGNVSLTGANSTATTDNKVTPGTGNDVVVLSTTAGLNETNSSNETIVYAAADLGNDTIVNFSATGNGIDKLDFTALGGRGTAALGSLSADKSVVVGAPTLAGVTPLTAKEIAALFTDSATAINHVYVAVDSTNIGSIYKVADAAGTAADNVTATLVGTIDLGATPWATLTAANFV